MREPKIHIFQCDVSRCASLTAREQGDAVGDVTSGSEPTRLHWTVAAMAALALAWTQVHHQTTHWQQSRTEKRVRRAMVVVVG